MTKWFYRDKRFWIALLVLLANVGALAWIAGHAKRAAFQELVTEMAEKTPTVAPEPVAEPATNQPPAISAAKQVVQPKKDEREFTLNYIYSDAPSFGDISITLNFSLSVDLAEAHNFITTEPAVKLSFSRDWMDGPLILSGAFEADSTYTVIVRKGFPARNGKTLASEIRRTVKIGDRQSSITVAVEGRYLTPYGKLLVPLSSMNVTQSVARLARVLPQNIVQLAMREQDRYRGYSYTNARHVGDELGEWVAVSTNRLANTKNREQRTLLPLSDILPKGEQRGVFAVSLQKNDSEEEAASKLICITDLGVSALHNDRSVTVWVNSLSSGHPLADCEVQLYAPNGSEVVRGRSDAQGVVELTVPNGKDPFLLAAQLAADSTFITLDCAETGSERTYLKERECEAFVMNDRGIYRHGETIFTQALLRDAHGVAVPEIPVVMEIVRSDGSVVASQTVVSDALGSVSMRKEVPQVWRSGRYNVHVKLPGNDGRTLGASRVLVESFVPPQIRVALQGLPTSVTNGTELSFAVSAEHLFGTPAVGLMSAASLLLTPDIFKPQGWEGWLFGDHEKQAAPMRSDLGKVGLNDHGRGEYTCQVAYQGQPPAALKATIEGSVVESGGRALSSSKAVVVHPYPFYIGIQTAGRTFVEATADYELRFAAISPQGVPLREAPALNVQLERINWVTSVRRGDGGRYEWVSERVKNPLQSATAIADGRWNFRVGAAGDYLVTVSDPTSGASTSWSFSAGVAGQQDVAWSYEKPATVEIVLDKPFYQPGEQARVQLRAPFAGSAWLTLRRDEVLLNHVFEMTNNTAEVMIEVGEWSPNVEVGVVVVRPAVAENVWRTHRAMGKVPLCVQPAARVLSVLVDKPSAVCAPGGKLPLTVVVRDAAGQPTPDTRVTLFAVDSGICMLTGHKTPDPAGWFFVPRVGDISLSDVYRSLMPISTERMWGAASHIGGDDDDELSKRLNPVASRRFKPLALCLDNMVVDERGLAVVELDLPEFAGELTLMAVAWNKSATGSSGETIKVRRQVVVQPDFPRVLAPGDHAGGVIVLHNESDTNGAVTLQVEATANGSVAAQFAQEVELAQGASTTLPLPLKALDAPGNSEVRVRVSGGDRTPYDESFELPVRPAQALSSVVATHIVEPGQRIKLTLPGGMMAGTVKQRVNCSAIPVVNWLRALEYLESYPFGCLEQTVSGVFPLLPLAKLVATLPAGSTTLAEEAPARIANALQRIRASRREDGYAAWSDILAIDPFATIYTAHFLVEAENTGYAIPEDERDHACSALRDCHDKHKIYQLYVKALAGMLDYGDIVNEFEDLANLTREERLMLARALARKGEPEKARTALRSVAVVSGLREAAFGLLAAVEIDPHSPLVVQCVQEIERLRTVDSHWGTTQNNALALLALGTWQLATPVQGDGTLQVALAAGGAPVSSGVTNLFSWVGDGTASVELQNQGQSPFYVAQTVEGVALEPLPAVSDGIKVKREWLNLAGEALAADEIKRGDLIVVKLTVELLEGEADDVIVEDLLPACLEIEGNDLRLSGALPWIEKPEHDWVLHKEARDDRMLLFSKKISGEQQFFYSVRVVSAGDFVVPAISATRMYMPQVIARGAQERLRVK